MIQMPTLCPCGVGEGNVELSRWSAHNRSEERTLADFKNNLLEFKNVLIIRQSIIIIIVSTLLSNHYHHAVYKATTPPELEF